MSPVRSSIRVGSPLLHIPPTSRTGPTSRCGCRVTSSGGDRSATPCPRCPHGPASGRTWAPSVLVAFVANGGRALLPPAIGASAARRPPTPTGPFVPSRSILECQLIRSRRVHRSPGVRRQRRRRTLLWKSDNAHPPAQPLWAAQAQTLTGCRWSPAGPDDSRRRVWEHYTVEAPAMNTPPVTTGCSIPAAAGRQAATPLGALRRTARSVPAKKTTAGPWYVRPGRPGEKVVLHHDG